MTYFLDFDRTLFDFDSFFRYLIRHPSFAEYRARGEQVLKEPRGTSAEADQRRDALWADIDMLYADGKLAFKEDELTQFLYPDAVSFLEEHGRETVIVTTGGVDLAFQRGKVAASGINTYVAGHVFVSRGNPKGPAIAAVIGGYQGPFVFIDDLAREIDSVIETCPEVKGYEMRRDGKEGCGRYPVLRDLATLPT